MRIEIRAHLTASLFALLLASAGKASGQAAKYCSGALVSNAFYTNVVSNGKTSEVWYYAIFQNLDPQRRAMTALMVRMPKLGDLPVSSAIDRFDLAPAQQQTIKLFKVNVSNSSGAGAPNTAQVGSVIRFVCNYHPG